MVVADELMIQTTLYYGTLQRNFATWSRGIANGSLGLTREPFHELFARSREVVHDLFATHSNTWLTTVLATPRESNFATSRPKALAKCHEPFASTSQSFLYNVPYVYTL